MAIGYSEPQAGTDLAALNTRAVRDGDAYVINGQKIHTSLAHVADYVFLAMRTGDPATDPRHMGTSVLLVPTDSPGFSRTPIYTVPEGETNTTFYDNVRVPASHMVGVENQGWQVITSQLNREHLTLMNPGTANLMYVQVLTHVAQTRDGNGELLINLPWVQSALARVHASLRALQLACRQQAWSIAQQTIGPAEASAVRVYGDECFLQRYRLMQEVLDPDGLVKRGYPGVHGWVTPACLTGCTSGWWSRALRHRWACWRKRSP